MLKDTLDATDKKIADIEAFIDESNRYVASVLAQLDENKRKMDAMGLNSTVNVSISDAERKMAINALTEMGYGHLFEDLEQYSNKVKVAPEPDQHTIKVNRNFNRRFNMI